MADTDAALVAALKVAKNKELNFVFVGPESTGKLIVAKKPGIKVLKSDIDDAKKEVKSNTVVMGKCKGPPGDMVFKVKKPKATLATAIKKAVQRQAKNMTIRAAIEQLNPKAGEDFDDGEEEATDAAAPAAAPAVEPAAPRQANVLGIQKALKKLGYDPGKIDGIMALPTQDAIKKFQQHNGLTADGGLTPKTQAALANALRAGAATAGGAQAGAGGAPAMTAAPVQVADAGDDDVAYREPYPMMDLNYKPKPLNGGIALRDSVGHQGKNLTGDVKEVQNALNRVADAGLRINGVADDKTIAAINAFQKSIGIASPDGLVEVGGLTARKLAGAKVIKPEKKDNIVASPQHYQDTVKQAARDVSRQARINASLFARRVTAGCDDFVVFAKSKIDKLKEAEEARAQMIDLLAKGFSMAVGAGVLTQLGEREVAKYVADKIIDLLRDKIVDKTKDLATSSKSFQEVVDSFVQNTKDRANAIEHLVSKAVDKYTDRIINAMEAGEPLSKEDDKFIEPFVFADVTGADGLLERQLGIPGAASAKKVQLNILRGLVAAFMKLYLTATATEKDNIKRIVSNSTPGEDAAVYAAKYTKARERHLDEIDNQVQDALDKKQAGKN